MTDDSKYGPPATEEHIRWWQGLSREQRMEQVRLHVGPAPHERPELLIVGLLQKVQGFLGQMQVRGARYVVTGGIAAVFHGIPRGTPDLDLLIDPDVANVQALLDALYADGLIVAGIASAEHVASNEVTVVYHHVKIDVETATPGVDFETAWARRHVMRFRDVQFPYIAVEDLIGNKMATRRSDRPIDTRDLRLLGVER